MKVVSNAMMLYDAMMRDRYFARPWNHILAGALFGYIGYNMDRLVGQLLEIVNEKRDERGLRRLHREDLNMGTLC